MTLKGIQQKFYKLQNRIDLTKKYPGYFNKGILRTMWGVFFLVVALAIINNIDTINQVSIYCPENTMIQCRNPVYQCQSVGERECVIVSEYCQEFDICDKKYLSPGEHYGAPINPYGLYYDLMMITIAIGFMANHVYYKWRRK